MHLIGPGEPRRFVQVWPSAATGEWVVREGVLGRTGKVRETGLIPDTTPVFELASPYVDKGYVEVDEDECAHIVVQYPTLTSARDTRLIAHASEWLTAVLDERGLGWVDGYDRGKRISDGRLVVNIFARVHDGELGCVATMAAVRKGAADETRATIAHRETDAHEWTVRYARKSGKLPGEFSL